MPKNNKEKPADGNEADLEAPATCGHVNKQHYGADGRLTDLACELETGHEGDHSAAYQKKIPIPTHDKQGRVIETRYNLEDAETSWSDAAGTPAKDIQAGHATQLTQFQSDLVQEVLRKDPSLSAEQAVAMAKQKNVWLAGA